MRNGSPMATMITTEKVAKSDPAAISVVGIVSNSWTNEGKMALSAMPSIVAHAAAMRDARRIEPYRAAITSRREKGSDAR